jgi:hypothetical protein
MGSEQTAVKLVGKMMFKVGKKLMHYQIGTGFLDGLLKHLKG